MFQTQGALLTKSEDVLNETADIYRIVLANTYEKIRFRYMKMRNVSITSDQSFLEEIYRCMRLQLLRRVDTVHSECDKTLTA